MTLLLFNHDAAGDTIFSNVCVNPFIGLPPKNILSALTPILNTILQRIPITNSNARTNQIKHHCFRFQYYKNGILMSQPVPTTIQMK